MRDIKQGHSEKSRGGNCEEENNGTKMQRWKLHEMKTAVHKCRGGLENAKKENYGTMLQGWKMRHRPPWKAKRTFITTLVNFSLFVLMSCTSLHF